MAGVPKTASLSYNLFDKILTSSKLRRNILLFIHFLCCLVLKILADYVLLITTVQFQVTHKLRREAVQTQDIISSQQKSISFFLVVFPPFPRIILDGTSELEEYDIARPLPTHHSGVENFPEENLRRKRSAIHPSLYWSNGRVPYEFATNMSK